MSKKENYIPENIFNAAIYVAKLIRDKELVPMALSETSGIVESRTKANKRRSK